MDNELQYRSAETETHGGKSPAFVGRAAASDDAAPRIETHWTRILYCDLFARTRRELQRALAPPEVAGPHRPYPRVA